MKPQPYRVKGFEARHFNHGAHGSSSQGTGPPTLDDDEELVRETAEEEGVPPRVVKRKAAMAGWGDEVDHVVHPSLKKFHSTVTKLVDVTDELVFRRIVSFL